MTTIFEKLPNKSRMLLGWPTPLRGAVAVDVWYEVELDSFGTMLNRPGPIAIYAPNATSNTMPTVSATFLEVAIPLLGNFIVSIRPIDKS
jgi:hypothetical protein